MRIAIARCGLVIVVGVDRRHAQFGGELRNRVARNGVPDDQRAATRGEARGQLGDGVPYEFDAPSSGRGSLSRISRSKMNAQWTRRDAFSAWKSAAWSKSRRSAGTHQRAPVVARRHGLPAAWECGGRARESRGATAARPPRRSSPARASDRPPAGDADHSELPLAHQRARHDVGVRLLGRVGIGPRARRQRTRREFVQRIGARRSTFSSSVK